MKDIRNTIRDNEEGFEVKPVAHASGYLQVCNSDKTAFARTGEHLQIPVPYISVDQATDGPHPGPFMYGGDPRLKVPLVKHAPDFLEDAAKTMRQRAALRDAPATGERSMAKTVAIFNAWTGNTMSVQDGWRFMIALKQAREVQGFYNEDDYVDGAAYVALLGEEESGNETRSKP